MFLLSAVALHPTCVTKPYTFSFKTKLSRRCKNCQAFATALSFLQEEGKMDSGRLTLFCGFVVPSGASASPFFFACFRSERRGSENY